MGKNKNRNDVGTTINNSLKQEVVEVRRMGD